MRPANLIGAMLLLGVSCGAPPPGFAGKWVGGVHSGGAFAPVRVSRASDTSAAVDVELAGFSFLGFGATEATARQDGDSVRLTLRDWRGETHELAGRLRRDRLEGSYQSYRGLGRFVLRRLQDTGDSGTAPTQVPTGLYRGATTRRVSVRSMGPSDLILADLRDGTRRRAVREGPGSFVHGYTYDDWTEDGGSIQILPATGSAPPRMIWTHWGRGGGRDTDTLVRIPVAERTLTFRRAGATLEGTLLLPPGPGPFPAVVFVHGSGAADRETNRENAHLVLSQGIAAFIFDKRGVGRSGGSLDEATLEVLGADGAAAARLVASQPDVLAACVGVYGTSQGGWVAPLVAGQAPQVSFVITVSGPGVASDEQELFRRTLNLRGDGYIPGPAVADSEVARAVGVLQAFFGWVRTGEGGDSVASLIREVRRQSWFPGTELPDSLDPQSPPAFVRGFRSGMEFDVERAWGSVRVPSLQFFGALDPFVPAERSFDVFSRMTRDGAELHLLPTGDHWMYQRDTGSPRLPSPGYVPAYLATMRDWLERLTLQRCQ